MSKVFKSGSVTVSEDRRVRINVEQICAPPVSEEPEQDREEVFEDPTDIVENAKSDANRILELAERKADNIIEKAKDTAVSDAKRVMEVAREKGYADGYETGVNAAEVIKQDAERIKRDAYIFRDELMETAEPQIIEMIIGLLEKLLTDEVEINPQVISILVRQGLKQATMIGDLVVHVSKGDYQNVMDAKDDILSSFETMARIEFVEDASVRKGECVIETALGSIDCGIRSQFRELKKNIYYLLNIR